MKILIIEDDRDLAETIQYRLRARYEVIIANNAKEGQSKLLSDHFDLVILDYFLPDKNGTEICKWARARNIHIPILMLTGQSETSKKVEALDIGADDYLTKPFNFDEFLARIRALIRRHNEKYTGAVITIGDFSIDLDKKIVKRGNKEIELGRTEFDLLKYFVLNRNKIVTRTMIFDHVWPSTFQTDTNLVDVHIKYLRDALDRSFKKKLIKTVYGKGYKFA
jgi:DNA-binding response OmpR family regulator